MPELVEVETTRRDLKKTIVGKKIIRTKVYLNKIVYDDKNNFINKTEGQIINDIKRRGKWLLIELESNYIVVHFRMEGRFYLKKLNDVKDKHDYVVFDFEDSSLHYNDPRLFGKLQIISKDKILEFFTTKKLGLEYDDNNLTVKYLKDKLKSHHTGIKKVLLDQSTITGIGNIYANEILFRSKIHPSSYADKLSSKKLQSIIDNTKIVFEESLKYKGTYPNIDGTRGSYEKHLLVHDRKNEKCVDCGTLIIKEQISNRGAYYCPNCQKKV